MLHDLTASVEAMEARESRLILFLLIHFPISPAKIFFDGMEMLNGNGFLFFIKTSANGRVVGFDDD